MRFRYSRSNAYIAIGLALVISCLIWQFGELRIQALGERLVQKLTGKPLNQIEKIDAEGIPYQLYREHGARYNPLFIARRAQELAAQTVPNGQAQFRKLSDWLLAHSTATDSSLVCYYDFGLPELGLKAPWPSALAQAVTMNVFLKRSVLDQDSLWAERAKAVFRSLQLDAGLGLSSRIAPDQIWWWEYPGADSLFVLNGMISVLFELWDYHQASADPRARALFEEGYQAVLHKLPDYDYHGYSRYASSGEMAGRLYHQKHIAQLQKLNSIQAHPVLIKYMKRWSLHDKLPLPWQFIFNPRPGRMIGFFFTWLGLSLLFWILLSLVRTPNP